LVILPPLRPELQAAFTATLKVSVWVDAARDRRNTMGTKLYIGNLNYNVSGADLEQLCSQHGTVRSAEVITDRVTGQSKGFGFVEMGSPEEAQAAITALNGRDFQGRALTVNEARPREPRPGGGGGGRGYGGGGRPPRGRG
jgi:RNA recognition motif-containing protein